MDRLSQLEIKAPISTGVESILTPQALEFVGSLHRHFNSTRETLLNERQLRQKQLLQGTLPTFLPETENIRQSEWQVAPTPDDLQDRRVEITGPVERKMMINALNSGAKVFMADLEDACAPTWENVTVGQVNLFDAVRRTIKLETPEKTYQLNDQIAVLMVRPRGWHLVEKHVLVDGEPISASLFDFGLFFFHNAQYLLENGTAPYFYLPKMESHKEARLWNDVFNFAQDALNIPRGTIRATVLIETILAAFEMEEILYELRDHSAGLNAGRWDYIFSTIKKFATHPDFVLPDRVQITMAVPFMRAYTELLVKTCHKRGAHAMGGMSAFIPNRREPDITERALAKVREDKLREAGDGFDGAWVAHPDLVPVVMEIFDEILGENPNQKSKQRPYVVITPEQLLQTHIEGGKITENGVRANIRVAVHYLAAWLKGSGAVAIENLMEDTATAEISRAQLWQWLQHGVQLEDGRTFTRELYARLRDDELTKITDDVSAAVTLLDTLVLNDTFAEFLTLVAY